MRKINEQEKELAISLARITNKIVPELVEQAGASDFELTISKDGQGVGFTIAVDYKADLIHRGLNDEEWMETWKVIASKALQDHNGNIKKAARQLGLTVDEFKHHMTKCNL